MLGTGQNFPGGGSTISPEGPFGYVTIGNAPKLLLLNAPTNVRLAGGGRKGKGFQTKFCVKFPTSGIQVPGQIDRTQRQLKLF
jgi:hypothetical protein